MYWAIRDYQDFKKVSGRYTPFHSSSLITWHYQKSIPASIMGSIESGDIILLGNYNRFVSWLIMYLSDSITSHAMIYAGNGRVWHSTTSGPRLESLSNYFGWGMVFMPIKISGDSKEKSDRIEDWIANNKYKNGYNYPRVIILGLSFLLCLNPFEIHHRNFYDMVLVSLILAVIFLLFGWLALGLLFLLYPLFVICFHEICCRLGLQGEMQWTPGNMEKLCFVSQHYKPLINVRGFQQYMLAISAYIEAEGIDVPMGTPIPIPEGLQIKVKKKNQRKSYVFKSEIEPK